MRKSFCLVMLLIIVGLPSLMATAQTPSPTPLPIPPSPTSQSIFLRPTPTPLTLHMDATPRIDVSGSAGPLADQVINDYRAININHVIDFILYAMIGFVAIAYVVRNLGDWTKRQ